jgi:hypothetical protein
VGMGRVLVTIYVWGKDELNVSFLTIFIINI